VQRQRSRGRPFQPIDPDDRFSAKLLFRDNGCWDWTSTKIRGYAYLWVDGKIVRAARWCYERFIGPIPLGLTIDHLCKNSQCVNPFHLEPVTLLENRLRAHPWSPNCKRGHPLSGDNLKMSVGRHGLQRGCRICDNEAGRLRRQRSRCG